MTLWTPHYLQTKTYSAQRLRMVHAGLVGVNGEGVVDAGDFAVGQRGAGANMSVDVAAGAAFVRGDDSSRQGFYHVVNDAIVNVAVAASHASLPRIDTAIVRVYDSTVIGGGTDAATVEVLTGTATSGATLANRTGAATLPATAIRIADILVPGASTTVTTANIGNPKDPRVGLTGYPAGSLSSVAGAPAQYYQGKPAGYVPSVKVTSTSQSIASGGQQPMASFTTETWDTDAMHDTVTNPERITAKTPGMYLVMLEAHWQDAGTDSRNLELRNSAAGVESFVDGIAGSAKTTEQFAQAHVRLGYGDWIEATANQNSGSGKTLGAAGTPNTLTAEWIAP